MNIIGSLLGKMDPGFCSAIELDAKNKLTKCGDSTIKFYLRTIDVSTFVVAYCKEHYQSFVGESDQEISSGEALAFEVLNS